VRGYLELDANGQGFKAIEVRESLTHGGDGGRGVFVKRGYALRPGTKIPYFGVWIHSTDIDWNAADYVVGPIHDGMCVNGDPAVMGNQQHPRDSQIWAGALVNQANFPEERNCYIRAVPKSTRHAQSNSYKKVCTHELRCVIETSRTVYEGEELLTNYAWNTPFQMMRKCGYDYYAEQHLHLARGEGPIQDTDLSAMFPEESQSDEDSPSIRDTSYKR
jgi:hypothetical protein